MKYIIAISKFIFVAMFTAAMVVLPFVLLHWGLEIKVSWSIVGAWAWTTMIALLIVFTDTKSTPDENPEDAENQEGDE